MGIYRFIASKYLKSRKESGVISLVSLISITGITLGTMVLIIALSVMDGFEGALTQKIIDFDSHIYISGFGKRDLGGVPLAKSSIKKILDTNNIVMNSPFISRYAVIKKSREYEGVELQAINNSSLNLKLDRYMIAGECSFVHKGDSTKGIVIGEKLANTLGASIGDKLIIFSLTDKEPPTIQNPPIVVQFYVTGIYRSSMAKYDDLYAYINLSEGADIYNMPNSVSGYNIKLKDINNLEAKTEELQDELGYPYYVRTVFKEHQNIFTWLELQKAPIPLILSLITIVAAFNMIGTLLMIVIEKTSDIGILRTLGAAKYQIGRLVLTQGMYLSGIGVLIGNLLALLLSLLQNHYEIIKVPASVYYISSVKLVIDPVNYGLVSLVALIFCYIASYIPGRFAASIAPVNAMRFK